MTKSILIRNRNWHAWWLFWSLCKHAWKELVRWIYSTWESPIQWDCGSAPYAWKKKSSIEIIHCQGYRYRWILSFVYVVQLRYQPSHETMVHFCLYTARLYGKQHVDCGNEIREIYVKHGRKCLGVQCVIWPSADHEHTCDMWRYM